MGSGHMAMRQHDYHRAVPLQGAVVMRLLLERFDPPSATACVRTPSLPKGEVPTSPA